MSAARIFRYDLQNSVSGHTLLLQTQHLCGGCYTPAWEPPEQIDSGQTRGMQAESCGFMTGTEGWVKYQIRRDSAGEIRGLVYLYWTNPYWGVTFGRTALATLRWTANCDEDPPAAGSGFSSDEDPPFGFTLSMESTGHNGSPTDIDNLSELYRVPLAPVFIFGAAGIWERMDVTMKLSSSETPTLFPGPGQRTMSLETHPKRTILEGQWSGNNVNVGVRPIWGGQYEITLADSTPGRALNVTTICSFGTGGLAKLFDTNHALESLVSTGNVGTSHSEIAKANVALVGVSEVLRAAGVSENNGASRLGLSTPKVFTSTTIKKQVQEIGVKDSLVLDALAAAAAEHAKESAYTLWPAPDVALQLYQQLEDGRLAGYQLLYQRVLGDGTVLASAFLTFRPSLS